MKLLGGQWSKGDLLALIGVVAAILAIPGMPKLFHWDSENSSHVETSGAAGTTAPPKPVPAAPVRVSRVQDVSSGQVNFGCDQTLPVETSIISFGKNPKDIGTRAAWLNTDNVKTQNQSGLNIGDPIDHHVSGAKATGSISGRDSQSVLGVKNCPGGGHGELTLHASWTEEQ